MAIGQFMPMFLGNISPIFETAFDQPLANNSSTSYANRLVRVLIGASRLSKSGKRVRLRFSPKTSGSNNVLESVYIGRQASSGNAYNFDASTITQVLFNGGSSATLTVGGPPVWSDDVMFDLDNTKPVMVSIGYSSAAQQAFTVGSAISCTTYFKDNARLEAGNALVTGSVSSSNSVVVTLDRIDVAEW